MKMLELYTHEGCFTRQEAAEFIQKVLKNFPEVHFQEIDMLKEPEKASQNGIRISPTLVYNGHIVSVGIPSEEKLRNVLKAKEEVA